ncbi:MAG TPA: SGNH/GDSL hydrolase family protein [Thermoleophilaceae bacterium]
MARPTIRSYVAIGDSFTAGIDVEGPRWADEVATALGADVRYENLASIGAMSADVEREQLPRALELEPDVVSLICGANDVLLSVRPDPDAYATCLARMFARLAEVAPAATIVTATYPDLSRFRDLRPRSRARVERGMREFNEICRTVAREHDVVLLEGFDHPEAERRGSFAADGFHPSAEGHRRAAVEFVHALRNRLGNRLHPMQEVTS